jgi:hypothetical protein
VFREQRQQRSASAPLTNQERTAPETSEGSPGGWLLRNRETAEPVRATGLGSSLAAWLLRNREVADEVRPAAGPEIRPAAEDPRIFELLRVIGQDELRAHGLEVETRPERAYRRQWPGSARADEVRLDYHGVGTLQVATHAHDGISTRGLGLMFPAHTVHARDSTAVVVGNNCELTQVDHVHIRQAVIADDDALRSPQVERVLAKAVPGRDNSRVVRDLRATLNRLVERPADNGPSRAERKLRADCTAEIYDCESVQLGDDAMTRLDSHYVVERMVIPAGALLADSEDLARRYVDVVTGADGDPGALAGFLCDLVGTAENATDDNILGYADGLPRQPATLLGLFGMATIDDMTSIMIGTGNELHTELDLTTAGMRLDDRLSRRLDATTPWFVASQPSPDASSSAPSPDASSLAERRRQGW